MSEEVAALLESLISVNENILETMLDIKLSLESIHEEPDWSKDLSSSKMHLEKLDSIESILQDVALNIAS
ncbi:hypothetical protein ACKC9G_12395 [Pokkaliibacter sp. CJK22405]|uniref:hypothetical protein n=1 Tax=Pokkaliibacter sp. CJK22405 TaxID=3384615 RepID=UPI0039849D83